MSGMTEGGLDSRLLMVGLTEGGRIPDADGGTDGGGTDSRLLMAGLTERGRIPDC